MRNRHPEKSQVHHALEVAMHTSMPSHTYPIPFIGQLENVQLMPTCWMHANVNFEGDVALSGCYASASLNILLVVVGGRQKRPCTIQKYWWRKTAIQNSNQSQALQSWESFSICVTQLMMSAQCDDIGQLLYCFANIGLIPRKQLQLSARSAMHLEGC